MCLSIRESGQPDSVDKSDLDHSKIHSTWTFSPLVCLRLLHRTPKKEQENNLMILIILPSLSTIEARRREQPTSYFLLVILQMEAMFNAPTA